MSKSRDLGNYGTAALADTGSGANNVIAADASGNVGIGVVPETWFPSLNTTALQIGDTTSIWSLTNGAGDLRTSLDSNLYIDASGNDKYLNTGPGTRYQQIAGEHRWSSAASGTADSTATVSDRMRINSAGNLLVGTTSDFASGTVDGIIAQGTNKPAAAFSNTASGQIVKLYEGGSLVGSISCGNSGTYLYIGASASVTGLGFGGSYVFPTNGAASGLDNANSIGSPSYRWDNIYATNDVIQTSDRNEKQDILEITTAEYNVAKACKGLLRSFRWKSAVEKKGDDARIHFGIIAQDLEDAFTTEGLDAGRYAMFTSDTWWETQTEVAAVEAVEEVTDEDGNVTTEAVEAVDAYTRTDNFYTLAEAPAGATERTRLGVRYSELLAFIIAAI